MDSLRRQSALLLLMFFPGFSISGGEEKSDVVVGSVRKLPQVVGRKVCEYDDFEVRKVVNGFVVSCRDKELVFSNTTLLTQWIKRHYEGRK
jgi:hypothetical protein